MTSQQDKIILRELAKRISEIAALPIMEERRSLWKKHNQLKHVRPLFLIFPEGGWYELLPPEKLQCTGENARQMEMDLRQRIYTYEHFPSDNVVEKEWAVNKIIHSSGWGLEPKQHASSKERGAWGFDPVLKENSDLQKLTFPKISYDQEKTEEQFTEVQEIFGDILEVKLKGVWYVAFHLMAQYTALRGLEQAMLDMYEDPQFLHESMALLAEGNRQIIQQYMDLNLLSLNNDSSYHSSGGLGYTDELPLCDYNPERIRPGDIWASAESQELAQVSPKMHLEFALVYEKRLLEPFGLNGYGCCEDLTLKLEEVFKIPQLRRISISPWANVKVCAEKLQDKYIFSWKPQPAHLAGDFDITEIRNYIRQTLEVTPDCILEIILKDTHTCDHHPERFDQWAKIVRELL